MIIGTDSVCIANPARAQWIARNHVMYLPRAYTYFYFQRCLLAFGMILPKVHYLLGERNHLSINWTAAGMLDFA